VHFDFLFSLEKKQKTIYDLIRYFSILEVSKALNHRLLIMSKDTLKKNAKQETFDLFPVKGKAIELQYSGEKKVLKEAC